MASVYLDHNATTRLRPQARAALLAALDEGLGNPSSLHSSGRRARLLLDQTRERVAAALGVHEDEIVFTSGGTEANNLALFGVLRAQPAGRGLVTTAIEHSSVLGPARALEREGRPLVLAPVDADATVDVDALLAAAARPECGLVSVMAANNEIGTCLPLGEIGARLERLPQPPRWHTDAVQALGRVPLRLREWGCDLATLSAHKVGGPVGVGVLVRRAGVALHPLLFGGEQEGGLRPGTENVAAIVAAGVAIELAAREQADVAQRLSSFAADLWKELESRLPGVRCLGLPLGHARRLPGTLLLLAPEQDGKLLVMRLDLAGLECSAGSACASGSLEPSHVLLALGFDERAARAGLRVSLGRDTTWTDVGRAVDILRTTLGSTNAKRAVDTGL